MKCVDVVESFICRIEEVNPKLNCVVVKRYEDARAEAKEVDEVIASNKYSEETLAKDKPFYGVPFTTKDCLSAKGNDIT